MPVCHWSPWCTHRGALAVGSSSQECQQEEIQLGGGLLILAKHVDGERKKECT